MGKKVGIPKKKVVEPPVTVVPRSEWSDDVTIKKAPKLKFPLSNIRYGFTSTETCKTKGKCIHLLQSIQYDEIQAGHEDVTYNFYIGGDGVVYEGRGWEFEAERPPRLKKLKGKCLDIAYIGEFKSSIPPTKMSETADKFVREAIEDQKLQDMPRVLGLHDFREEGDDYEFKDLF